MRFGVCYYPEHWPRERWEIDAELMRAGGIDLVRIAEFAWSLMEPAPEQYTWEWLDTAIETLSGAGLDVMLGTPTATPPAWATQAHPDILRWDADGRPRAHGSRRHYCPNSPVYRSLSRRIVRAMGERYGGDARIMGWQIDNEFGGGHTARCYCPNCAQAFRAWLKQRYVTLPALNRAWGAVFWSQSYTDWDQIALPDGRIDKPNPSQELDYFRFASDSFVAYQQEQIAVLRELAPGRPITHNFMGLFRDLDQFDLAAPLDFVTWDNYPTGNRSRWGRRLYPAATGADAESGAAYDSGDPYIQAFAHALTYGLKQQPFWVMEQQAGHINWGDVNPRIRPGTPRLWTWHAVAEGADTIVYFRWRATKLAHEQYHSGLLHHDATPDVGWEDLARLRAEREALTGVTGSPLPAGVALLLDYDDLWALELQPHRADFDYLAHLFQYYRALRRVGIDVHVVSSSTYLEPYRLVIAPTLHLATPALAARLESYVTGGGTLVLGLRSGFKTASNLVTDGPLPGVLEPIAGATVMDWGPLPAGVAWDLQTELPLTGKAGYWVERLQPNGAQALVGYLQTDGAGLTENRLGKGSVFYIGWYPTPEQARALVRYLAKRLALRTADELPPGVLLVRRGPHTVVLNFTESPQQVTVDDHRVSVAARDIVLLPGE